jgi:RNA recognition motif-containing protein
VWSFVCVIFFVIMEDMEHFSDTALFVGDLSRHVSRLDIFELFSIAGDVADVVVKCSSVTGQPMGYGFVRMATREGAENALQSLSGLNLKGRCIRVGWAERNCRLIVKNLDRSARFQDLVRLFIPYGELQMQDSGQEISGSITKL